MRLDPAFKSSGGGDPGGSGCLEGCYRQRTDRAAAGHERTAAEHRPGSIHCLERDRQRLGKDREFKGHAIGQGDALRRVDVDDFAKAALDMWEDTGAAIVAHVLAQILATFAAGAAMMAGQRGVDDHPGAYGHGLDLGTHLDDLADEFVAQRQRLL